MRESELLGNGLYRATITGRKEIQQTKSGFWTLPITLQLESHDKRDFNMYQIGNLEAIYVLARPFDMLKGTSVSVSVTRRAHPLDDAQWFQEYRVNWGEVVTWDNFVKAREHAEAAKSSG